jgi:hypothetical protein
MTYRKDGTMEGARVCFGASSCENSIQNYIIVASNKKKETGNKNNAIRKNPKKNFSNSRR